MNNFKLLYGLEIPHKSFCYKIYIGFLVIGAHFNEQKIIQIYYKKELSSDCQ
jgi:hypothetical protein